MAAMECSFCGKTKKEAMVLVAGPVAMICGECIELSQSIYDERLNAMRTRTTTKPQAPQLAGCDVQISGAAELVLMKLAERGLLTFREIRECIVALNKEYEVVDLAALYLWTRVSVGLTQEQQEEFARAVAACYGIPWYNLRATHISRLATHIMHQSVCERVRGMPIRVVNGKLEVAVSDPSQKDVERIIKQHTGYDVQLAVATPTDIADAIVRCYTMDWDVGVSNDPAIRAALHRVYRREEGV